MKRRYILHADMDAFYASVEQRDRPELRGRPVIIGAQSARGVVSAASYEARQFGVRSAMPGFQARELCPDGVFLGGDMKKYAAVSRQVHRIFRDFTDQIEPLALDEAFLDITGSLGLFGTAKDLGHRLKARVREELGLIVSVGIAPNKLVAKIACTQGKPDGLLEVEPGQIHGLLFPLPIRSLWGIGPKTAERLQEHGYATIGDIAQATLPELRAVFGNHAGEMQKRARGDDDREVVTESTPKSIGEEATFETDVRDEGRISGAITNFSEAVAARARRAGYIGTTVSVKVKLSRRRTRGSAPMAHHELFHAMSRQKKLTTPTADGSEIRRHALQLYRGMGLQEPIRLLGVTLSGLVPEATGTQLELFAPRPRHDEKKGTSKGERLGSALDAITEKFGEGAIHRAVEQVGKITHGDRIKIGQLDHEGHSDPLDVDDDESDP